MLDMFGLYGALSSPAPSDVTFLMPQLGSHRLVHTAESEPGYLRRALLNSQCNNNKGTTTTNNDETTTTSNDNDVKETTTTTNE